MVGQLEGGLVGQGFFWFLGFSDVGLGFWLFSATAFCLFCVVGAVRATSVNVCAFIHIFSFNY